MPNEIHWPTFRVFAVTWGYSLPLRIAAITRGLRRPCMTAMTHNGFSSGA